MTQACDACDYARENPLSFYHREGCQACSLRGLAGSPFFYWRNTEHGKDTYIKALRDLQIADTPKAAHAIVEAEFNRLEAYKTRKINHA